MKEEIYYKSNDGITDIHAIIWKPTNEIKAIVQISHGMVEHINRYETFAKYLNNQGILVCGNDHLGHGKSVIDKDHYGYFCAKKQDKVVVDDVHELTMKIKKDYPNIPIYLLGHSMGSFIARNYIDYYSNELTGCIIIGSSYKSKTYMNICKIITWFTQFYHHGWFYRSPFLYKRTNTAFAKKFEEGKENPHCWLTNDQSVIESFKDDELANFRFTCNAYYGLFTLLKKACSKRLAKKIDHNLKLYILSGNEDPVGNFGKDIYKIEKQYKKVGIKNVKIKLYNGMRHELLNETNKLLVMNDIANFITK